METKVKVAYIIELKDGDMLDTKKFAIEKENLEAFKMHLGSMIEFRTNYKICSFNQMDKEKIVSGFKNQFSIDEVWTGIDFCHILGTSYDDIINQRRDDTIDNYLFVVDALGETEAIQRKVFEKAHIVFDEDGVHYIDKEE